MDNKLEYKLASPALMWGIILVGGIVLWLVVPTGRLFYSGALGAIILVLGVMDWLYVLSKAGSIHRQAAASVNNIDKLVTEGIYASVRHPIYAADIVLFWSIFLFFPAYRMLAVALWATAVFLFWASFEERMLEDKFLEDYREYKKRVPMIIPRFRRQRH